MSKLTFSKQINESILRKLSALENLNFEEFMKKDEYFELALSIAYLTLSKEKIIEKDINNPKRLERLTKRVYTKDIDQIFKNGFSKTMPIISNSDEQDNTWILDNIRDSIMHEALEIDEENQCIKLNNTQNDRKLNGIIPFSWIIDYAKYDILKKRVLDSYKVRGFYYNKRKTNLDYLYTQKEIKNNILYTVNIIGYRVNINDIEDKITKLFKEYSNLELDSTIIEKYKEEASKNNKIYNEQYLISFLYAKDLVQEQLQKEYPDLKINIYINKYKQEIVKTAKRSLSSYYKNYDLMYKQINDLVKPKGINLLYYLNNIITKLGTLTQVDENKSIEERKNLISYILNGDIQEYNNYRDVYANFEKSINILKTICFHTYGINSLVINNTDTYIPYYEKENLPKFKCYSNKKFIKFANKRKSLEISILDEQIKLFDKKMQRQQYINSNKNPEKNTLDLLDNAIENITNNVKTLCNELEKLLEDNKVHINYEKRNLSKMLYLEYKLKQQYENFQRATNKKDKYKVKKAISKLLNIYVEEETKYSYVEYDKEKEQKEILTMIRNSISHVGRINVKTDINTNRKIIVLNDYDNNNVHTGFVIGEYYELLKLLSTPLEEPKHKTKILKP